ncbi:MAG: hypothetical protein CM15mP109_04700 [Candidatus Dadabacteria bacterium]|nr:MAG: hypothetical protein CM15mP109_04700 [Candidatus Dadabacteria bacterium]
MAKKESHQGSGGMITKKKLPKILCHGCNMVISSGNNDNPFLSKKGKIVVGSIQAKFLKIL